MCDKKIEEKETRKDVLIQNMIDDALKSGVVDFKEEDYGL